jgi:hypothetical protein
MPEAVEPALQRRARLLDPLHERPDPSHLGACTGGDDDRARVPGGHRRGLVDHRCTLGEHGPLIDRRIGALAHRRRLAGQRRLAHRELGRREKARVGRDALSRLELDDVAGDELAGIDVGPLFAANDRRPGHLEPEQRVHCAAGAQLGDEADRGVDHEHGDDGDRVDDVTGGERNRRRSDQQQDDDAAELVEQDPEGAARRRRRELVRPDPGESRPGLIVRQPLGARFQPTERFIGRDRVPRHGIRHRRLLPHSPPFARSRSSETLILQHAATGDRRFPDVITSNSPTASRAPDDTLYPAFQPARDADIRPRDPAHRRSSPAGVQARAPARPAPARGGHSAVGPAVGRRHPGSDDPHDRARHRRLAQSVHGESRGDDGDH